MLQTTVPAPGSRPRTTTGRRLRRRPSPRALLIALAAVACAGLATPRVAAANPLAPAREPALGVPDKGIFPDLDPQVQIDLDESLRVVSGKRVLQAGAGAARPGQATTLEAVLDRGHGLLVLYVRGWPIKVYPLTGPDRLVAGAHTLALRPGDRHELAPLLARAQVRELAAGARPLPGDRDRDGIPDPLDIALGARKAAINRDRYGAGYITIPYPMGDVPRDVGVCTDVIIRALRNAGLDLQEAVHRDIRKAPGAYPMVERPNTSIDHRRVRTLLPYFRRHWAQHSAALNDPADPPRPGDILFLDTMPGRSGPDHVGIVSDRTGPSGMPLVINNWTDGTFTTEMDLFGWVPITHRFRVRAP
jgi:uncharacterized protein YijF (DUF1287 family)